MAYRIAVEDVEQNHWVAWAIDLPGCYSSAHNPDEAVVMAPTRISAYFTWLKNHGYRNLPQRQQIEIKVVETVESHISDGMYIVNAFFESDRKPMVEQEIEFVDWLLGCTREDLLEVTANIPDDRLTKTIPGEVQGSILGLLEHVAWTEWWYLDRLGMAFNRQDMPSEPFAMLETVRKHTRMQLPQLIDQNQIVEKQRERWSPRKVVRRILWHERDHTNHIAKLLSYI